MKSSNQRDEIAAARASLKENSSLLHSICSACLEHSDVASLTASKDSICNEIQNALNVISNASQGVGNKMVQPTSHTATLGSALDELEVCKPVNLQTGALLSCSLNSIALSYLIGSYHFLQKSPELSRHVCSIFSFLHTAGKN